MPSAAPPEGLAFDRIPTPAGEALVMWDKVPEPARVRLGRLRAADAPST